MNCSCVNFIVLSMLGVLTTVGGITDAFQIYVVPALVYMKMQKNKGIRNRSTYFYHFVFAWGVCLMTFTIGNTLLNLVRAGMN